MDIHTENYVFISYSSKNTEYAEVTRKLLIDKQIPCWMAPYDIPAGYKYAGVINDAVENCSCLLLLLTEYAQNSEFVNREVEIAVSNKKHIVTMQLEDIILNSDFKFYVTCGQIVPINAISENSPDMQKIIQSILTFTETDEIYQNPPKQIVSQTNYSMPDLDEFMKNWNMSSHQNTTNSMMIVNLLLMPLIAACFIP